MKTTSANSLRGKKYPRFQRPRLVCEERNVGAIIKASRRNPGVFAWISKMTNRTEANTDRIEFSEKASERRGVGWLSSARRTRGHKHKRDAEILLTFHRLTMFILFLILAVFQHYGASMPIIIDIREVLQSGPVIQDQKIRTRFDIVWSCVSTLFICTWVAIHPNIPPRGEGHTRSLWRRVKLMLWTLLVPELILIWAYKQWSAARYIAEYFEGECEVVGVNATC